MLKNMEWVNWIVDRPRWNLLFLVLVTLFASIGYYDPNLLFPKRNAGESVLATSAFRSAARVSSPSRSGGRSLSLSQADVLVVAKSDDFFTADGSAAIRHVVEELEGLEIVESVLWLDRTPMLNIFGMPEPVFPKSDATPERFAAAKQKAIQHPLIVGQLMSEDAKTLLILVRMNWLEVREDADCTSRIRETAIRAAAAHPKVKIGIQITGEVPMSLMIVSTQKSNQLKYQFLGYAMIFLMAIVLFRGLSAVIIVAIAPVLGVFWTLGFLRFLNLQDNPLNDVILPIMISLIGFTDGVHMMVQIRKQRALGIAPREATKKGLRDVGLACFLTLLTTSVGFASLAWANHIIVREFGWCCVIGICTSFTSVISVIPLLTASRFGNRLHIGHDRSIVDKNLAKIVVGVDFVIRHAKVVSWIGIGSTILMASSALLLRPDDRIANALPSGSEAEQAMAALDKAMGGLAMAQASVTWSESGVESSEVIQVMDEVDHLLNSEPLLGHPLSIAKMLAALPGDGPILDRSSMIELLPPPLKQNFLNMEQRTAKATFRVQDTGIATYGPVFERVEAGLKAIEASHPDFQLRLEGRPISRWKNLFQIVEDLASSLGSEALIILFVLGFAFRSVRIGLIAFVPNIFPLAACATALLLLGMPLDIVSVCSFTICLGIAVDDTIHFLTRYTEELAEGKDEVSAVRDAFVGVGTGMIMTTCVLITGFSSVLFSETRDHRVFCSMGILTMAFALLGDLFILPAMLVYFRKRTSESE